MDITSERLAYQKFTPDHLTDYLALTANEAVMRYITGRALSTKDATARFEASLAMGDSYPEAGFFSVKTKTDNTYVGLAKFVYTKPNQVEIGYALLPDFWGKQYATELVRDLLRYAETFPHLTELIAIVDEYNSVSARVLSKYQFTRLRSNSPVGTSVYYQLDLPFCRPGDLP